MRDWPASRVAEAAGVKLLGPAPVSDPAGPVRVTIDSRDVGPGDLFVGLPGMRVDGGRYAAAALAAGAWGVLVAPEHAEGARCAKPGALLAAEDPLGALGRLATAWRRELGCAVIGVTGSVGKTSTKDILAGMLAQQRRVVATPRNLNTDIGMPLVILGAPPGTEALVLEMGMRGAGQIADLARIAEPDVGVIVNVGPVHLELLGSVEAVAAVKAELIAGLRPGDTIVVPAGERLLEPYLRPDVATVTFGPGGDVDDLGDLEIPFASAHMRLNALAALAAARAVGVQPAGRIEVQLSEMRGQRIDLAGGVIVINDCYNANPMSMRAALEDLAGSARGRRVAVLGDMLELGSEELRMHAEVGERAREAGVDLLVTVGSLAAEMAAGYQQRDGAEADSGSVVRVATAAEAAERLPDLLEPGDTVLVKGSRGIGLEVVAEALQER
jgi:UDP-N-acetylmuramoyl-tripeptide--D-alanyl-D-alanine ligase